MGKFPFPGIHGPDRHSCIKSIWYIQVDMIDQLAHSQKLKIYGSMGPILTFPENISSSHLENILIGTCSICII